MESQKLIDKGVLPLSALRKGQRGLVQLVSSANKNLCGRLLTMGIVSGAAIEVLEFAPLGDPMKIRALGYELSLRLGEASQILVRLAS